MSTSEEHENSTSTNFITPPTTISPSEGGENSTTSIPRSIIEIQRSIIEMFKEYGATISNVGSQDPEKCFEVEDRGDEGRFRFMAEIDTDHLFFPGCNCFKFCVGGGDSPEEALEFLRDLLREANDEHLQLLPHDQRSLIEIQRSLIEMYKENGATISDVGSQDPEMCFKVESSSNGMFLAELDREHVLFGPGRSCCAQTPSGGGESREEALKSLCTALEEFEYGHKDGHPPSLTIYRTEDFSLVRTSTDC